MRDYSKMFSNKAPVVAQAAAKPETVASLLEWRSDLSDKVREHVDLIDKIVREDVDIITEVNSILNQLITDIVDFVERKGKLWTRITGSKTNSIDLESRIIFEFSQVDEMLKKNSRVDPFKTVEVNKLVTQVDYLLEQLDKSCNELEGKKAAITDDLVRDAANRRIQTLTAQQQLIAIGAGQIKQLAGQITSRPSEVKDYLNGRIPILKRLCLDTLSGKATISELRNQA